MTFITCFWTFVKLLRAFVKLFVFFEKCNIFLHFQILVAIVPLVKWFF